MHEAIFADIEIPATCAAVPAVRLSVRKVLLKAVVIRHVEQRLASGHHLGQNLALPVVELKQLAGAVMNDPDGGRKTKVSCALRNHHGIVWIPGPTADDRVDSDVELGVPSEPS